MCPVSSPIGIGVLLICMGFGYIVCTKGEKQSGFIRQLGYWIGSLIIISSMLIAFCGLHSTIYKKACLLCGKSHYYQIRSY